PPPQPAQKQRRVNPKPPSQEERLCFLFMETSIYHHHGPFIRQIIESFIPRTLEKLPKLESYDKTVDRDEHVECIDIVLDYQSSRGTVKYKLFVLTLCPGNGE
ncbi:hypothetical protein A2U01_0016161, partial [Trifolium medium]|nr:hypothetical protein [Trifolium medium]